MSLALADELFLMTHDLQSGKARVADPAMGLGLAAALLAELMFARSLVVSQGRIGLGEQGAPPNPLSEALYEETRNRLHTQEVIVRDWLAAHRRLVEELVADRLIRTGDLRRDVSRRFGRTVVRYFPVKPADAFIRAQRLPSYLRHRVELTEPDVALAVLARMMSPGRAVMELDAGGREYLDHLVPTLPAPVRELLAGTEASIVTAVRNPRF